MAEGYRVLDKQGATSIVYFLPGDPPRVCKAFKQDCVDSHFPIEKAAYERFASQSQPPSIPTYYGVHESMPAGIVLELAENKDLCRYLWKQKSPEHVYPDKTLIYRWAGQAAEALEFAHSLGVYNSDIHCLNFLIDHNFDLKVGDWAGASIDGSPPQSIYRLRYSLFRSDGTDVSRSIGISASTEIFALGSAIYYMIVGHEPWPELCEPEDEEEIKKRICTKRFPDTSKLPILGHVISECWHARFVSMTNVKQAIDTENRMNTSILGRGSSRGSTEVYSG